ncbi:hypothetical protein BH09PAT1_BH09PAT1_6470 [soil metagenome]
MYASAPSQTKPSPNPKKAPMIFPAKANLNASSLILLRLFTVLHTFKVNLFAHAFNDTNHIISYIH